MLRSYGGMGFVGMHRDSSQPKTLDSASVSRFGAVEGWEVQRTLNQLK